MHHYRFCEAHATKPTLRRHKIQTLFRDCFTDRLVMLCNCFTDVIALLMWLLYWCDCSTDAIALLTGYRAVALKQQVLSCPVTVTVNGPWPPLRQLLTGASSTADWQCMSLWRHFECVVPPSCSSHLAAVTACRLTNHWLFTFDLN